MRQFLQISAFLFFAGYLMVLELGIDAGKVFAFMNEPENIDAPVRYRESPIECLGNVLGI